MSFIHLLNALFGYFKYNSKHLRNIRNSKKILDRVKKLPHPGAKINYLRKIDPFVFEELILSAIQLKGFKIKRNKKYTGDGGIDGVFYDNNNQLILLQAKRYKGHIQKQHLEDFLTLVHQKKARKGLFIHTGKTSLKSLENYKHSKIQIVSGNKLLLFLNIL